MKAKLYLSDERIKQSENYLNGLLQNMDFEKQACYKPGQIMNLLNISYGTFIDMVNKWEPLEVTARNKKGLETFRIGNQRRIPHHGLIEWISINCLNGVEK